jgi:hypothetical protein
MGPEVPIFTRCARPASAAGAQWHRAELAQAGQAASVADFVPLAEVTGVVAKPAIQAGAGIGGRNRRSQ